MKDMSSLDLMDFETVPLEVGELKSGALCPEVKGFRVDGGLVIRVGIPLPEGETIVHPVNGVLEVEAKANDLVHYAPIKMPSEGNPEELVAEYCRDDRGDHLRIFIPYRN